VVASRPANDPFPYSVKSAGSLSPISVGAMGAGFTKMLTVATLESVVPSLALKVNESVPVKPAFEV